MNLWTTCGITLKPDASYGFAAIAQKTGNLPRPSTTHQGGSAGDSPTGMSTSLLNKAIAVLATWLVS